MPVLLLPSDNGFLHVNVPVAIQLLTSSLPRIAILDVLVIQLVSALCSYMYEGVVTSLSRLLILFHYTTSIWILLWKLRVDE